MMIIFVMSNYTFPLATFDDKRLVVVVLMLLFATRESVSGYCVL